MNHRFRRVYLHIGLGKTGTSTIQRQLLNQVKNLELNFNLHFPHKFSDPRPFDGNHTLFLTSAFGQSPEKLKANVVAGFGTLAKLADANRRINQQFEQGFGHSTAQNLLLSAEGIGHFDKDSLTRLADWLNGLAAEVTVVACLRHPLNALSSTIQQRLTNGAVLEDLYENPPYYRFRALFGRLETVFGREHIISYDFATAVRNEYGLLAALMQEMGFQPLQVYSSKNVTNASMSHEAALLLSALNRQRPVLGDNMIGEDRTPGDINAFLSIPGRKFRAPDEVHGRLELIVAPELLWLRENYGLELDPIEEAAIVDDYFSFSARSIDELAIRISDLANWQSRSGSELPKSKAQLRALLYGFWRTIR